MNYSLDGILISDFLSRFYCQFPFKCASFMDPIISGSVLSYGFGSRASNTGTIILDLLIVPADNSNSTPSPNGTYLKESIAYPV